MLDNRGHVLVDGNAGGPLAIGLNTVGGVTGLGFAIPSTSRPPRRGGSSASGTGDLPADGGSAVPAR